MTGKSTTAAVHGVFVDEVKIWATASPGADWWALYSSRQPAERLTCLEAGLGGGHWFVACDSRADAVMVRDQIAGRGINPRFLRVTTLAAALRARAARHAARAEQDAAIAAAIEADRPRREAWAWWINTVCPDRSGDRAGHNAALARIGHPHRGCQAIVLALYRRHLAAAKIGGQPVIRVTQCLRCRRLLAALEETGDLTHLDGESAGCAPQPPPIEPILVNAAGWQPPAEVPDGWLVANAPGPVDGDPAWNGTFRHGVFYAAAPNTPETLASWAAAGAWLVTEITNDEIAALTAASATARGYDPAWLEARGITTADLADSMLLPWQD